MSQIARFHQPRFPGSQPDFIYPPYRSTQTRGPSQPPIAIPTTLSEVTGPSFSPQLLGPHDADLTQGHGGEPIGERIVVTGRVLDENGRPVPNTMLEIWQANAAGRYLHKREQHNAPLDPHFSGRGRVFTDPHGRYRFITIRPGEYPWGNHHNAWRPAHIHLSLFGNAFAQRLVTQMYFPGDPLLAFDPIYQAIADERARQRLVSSLDWEHSISDFALAYRFDIVLRGREQTPWDQ